MVKTRRIEGNKRNPEGASTNLHPLGAPLVFPCWTRRPEGPLSRKDFCYGPKAFAHPSDRNCLSDGGNITQAHPTRQA